LHCRSNNNPSVGQFVDALKTVISGLACRGLLNPNCEDDGASFYVVVTANQIMSMTQGTTLIEQSSLSFHCHICHFISLLEIKFPCGIIVVEV